jgi:PAS domain S-box-containing protein
MSDLLYKKVLVVDDEPSYRSVIQKYLAMLGYESEGAEDAETALQKLDNGSYDLVISDIQMPGMDGVELLGRVHEHSPTTSFFMMTGHAGRYSYSDLIQAGALDYLTKPFEIGELKAKLRRLERERSVVLQMNAINEALARESRFNAAMADLSKALISSVPIEQISELTIKRARELTNSSCGCLVEVPPPTEESSLFAVSDEGDFSGTAAEPRFVCERCSGLHDCFSADPRPVLRNVMEDNPALPSLTPGNDPVERFLAVPIVMSERFIGSIALANSDRDYTEQDLQAVGRLAEIYGLAIRRKRDEEKLAEAKDHIEKVFENSADAIGIVDKHGRAVKWNRMAGAMFGYRVEELQGRKVFDLYADPKELDAMLTRLRREGSVRRYEIGISRKDGTVLPIELSISLLHADHGEVQGSVCVARDLSDVKKSLVEAQDLNQRLQQEILDRKKAEEGIQAAHAEMARLVASIPSILIGMSEDRRVVWWNSAAEETFGLKREEVFGRPLRECRIKWDWVTLVRGIDESSRSGAQHRLDDIRYVRSDGKEAFLGISVSPLGVAENGRSGLILLARDITSRKLMESQLAQAQKLESIGQLAAGIAHEINTPTQYVGDNTRFLEGAFQDLRRLLDRYAEVPQALREGVDAEELIRRMKDAAEEADLEYLGEEIPKAIQQSLEGIERVTRIVRAMKEFSHPGTEEKTSIDINNAIESTLTVARNEWKYVAEVVTDFDPHLPLVPCLPGEFNQVILNMIINAAHAIADVTDASSGTKGTISLSTRRVADGVEIRTGDTGGGIPETIRSRIFDPFFTTKEVGKGTGQGLAISHSVIVDKHGGSIAFETEVGKGTTFVIRLPVETTEA